MPKKDTRQIKLDPMEWKDAMRGVVGKKPGAPAKPAKTAKPKPKGR